MKITKRNGTTENLSFDKILKRLRKLKEDPVLGPIKGIDTDIISQKVINQIYDGISSSEMDTLAAQLAISMSISHPGYGELASRISISNLQKSTPNTFHACVKILYDEGIVNERVYKSSIKYKKEIAETIDMTRDYLFDYFGIKTLERSYLLKVNKKITERPQYMWMRVAVSLWSDDINEIKKTYNMLSTKQFIHASPTLFNAGTMREQNSSCFLLSTEDSVSGIYKTITDCAHISKYAGGIGVSVSNIRAKGSKIHSTNGYSDGIIPMLKVYNETSRYINQAGKRNGSFAIYLEPHHADIYDFLELKKNTGDVNLRARDLFYALWVSDLFMKKVEADDDWYLMCPNICKGLDDVYGGTYEKLYEEYVSKNMYNKKVKARDLWEKILISQIETGMPYMSYKDAVNKKSNQKHLGTIKSSNLCNEITLYNTPGSIAVCNIATISLTSCVVDNKFDFVKLGEIAKQLVKNLNRVIDVNFYPTPETEHNNKNNRPVAIGVQGLYNVFILLRHSFDSVEATNLNRKIFECIQYNAYVQSCEEAKLHGAYSTYEGSLMSKGIFQHDMWGITDLEYNWETLRREIQIHGVRNSLLTALPPTASTSQILGNVESFEVLTNNFYMRRVLSGNYPIINKYLVNDLIELDLWNEDMRDKIISNEGSVQKIEEIPDNLKRLYKTTWETSQKVTINLSADRAGFIDHSQSLNIFISSPSIAKLSSIHFYGWKKGLKTGMYYLRSLSATQAEKFSVKMESVSQVSCSIDNKEECTMCSG